MRYSSADGDEENWVGGGEGEHEKENEIEIEKGPRTPGRGGSGHKSLAVAKVRASGGRRSVTERAGVRKTSARVGSGGGSRSRS